MAKEEEARKVKLLADAKKVKDAKEEANRLAKEEKYRKAEEEKARKAKELAEALKRKEAKKLADRLAKEKAEA